MTRPNELPLPRPLTAIIDDIEGWLFRVKQATMIVEEFMDIYQGDPEHRGVCDRVAFCGILAHEGVAEIEKLLAEMLHGPRGKAP